MKVHQRIFLDLCLFLVYFVAAAALMYKGVYTENGTNPSGGLVLISEVRPTGGVGKANDEFVELYNPQSQPVIIGGWLISKMTKSASSTDMQQLFSFPSGAVLPSHGHLLVAHLDSMVSSTADYLYVGQALSDDNTVVLLDNMGLVMDLVGYGLAKNSETEPADPPNAQLPSIERKPGAEFGNNYDSNNNKLDFFRTQSSPQNINSPLTPLVQSLAQITTTSTDFVTSTEIYVATTSTVEIVSSTPIIVNTTFVTPTSTVSTQSVSSTTSTINTVGQNSVTTTTPQNVVGSVLITELYPMPANGEDEFVELFNRTSQVIDLTDWYLTDGSGSKTILSGPLAPMTFKVIEKPKGSLNNAGDLVNLFAINDVLIDKVAYGDWNDGEMGNNAAQPQTKMSIIRIHSTEDSNLDYFDFGLTSTSTKGLPNIYLPINIEIEDDEKAETLSVGTTSSVRTAVKKSEPLYVRITYPASALVGDEIVLDASLSSGGEGPRQFIWEMDDGIILRGETIKHIYKEPDTYSVILTLFDDTGTEKHKTIKIKIVSNPAVDVVKKTEETKQAAVAVSRIGTKNLESAVVFTQIGELSKVKTNSLVRVRGVLAAVFVAKTAPEYYLVGESAAGGMAAGTLVKTKSNSIDARVGDIIEITGKYIVNTTSGNYIQYGADDQLSVIGSGELLVPLSNTIKNIAQLSGGHVQFVGEVVEKKTNTSIVSDSTGEIKVIGDFGESIKIKDQVIVIGYIVRTKEGVVIRIVGQNDVTIKEVVATSTVMESSETIRKPAKPFTTFTLIGLIGTTLLGLVIKKFWFRKNELIEATEI